MDVVAVLDGRLATLPPGDHIRGLKAVRLHIHAALGHLQRGQSGDGTAFTDAIYRCNQAFEGSVKEAYRVLAGKDPNRMTPAKIELFLTNENVLRQRVLELFTNYRTKWRNESTHDYMLDFDENEALLAIVSVTVFAAVLSDQIRTKLATNAVVESAPHPTQQLAASISLEDEVELRVIEFAQTYEPNIATSYTQASSEYEGALAGYLKAQFAATPDIYVDAGYRLEGREADVAVRRGTELIAIEIKIMQKAAESRVVSGLSYLSDLLSRGFTSGILLATVASDNRFVVSDTWASQGTTVRAVLSQSLTQFLVNGYLD